MQVSYLQPFTSNAMYEVVLYLQSTWYVIPGSSLLLPCLMVYYIVPVLLLLAFFWCPCMTINISVQYNGGPLPDIILLTVIPSGYPFKYHEKVM